MLVTLHKVIHKSLFWDTRCCAGFSFKLNPFIERSETLEKMGAERPGVLMNKMSVDCRGSTILLIALLIVLLWGFWPIDFHWVSYGVGGVVWWPTAFLHSFRTFPFENEFGEYGRRLLFDTVLKFWPRLVKNRWSKTSYYHIWDEQWSWQP